MDWGDFSDLPSSSNYHQRPYNHTHAKRYDAFCRALHVCGRYLQHEYHSTSSVILLDTLYAMWILTIIIRLNYAYEDYCIVSWVQDSDFGPMPVYFEKVDRSFGDMLHDVDCIKAMGDIGKDGDYWGQSQIRNTYLALELYRQSIFGPAIIDFSEFTIAEIYGLLNAGVNHTRKSVKLTRSNTTREE